MFPGANLARERTLSRYARQSAFAPARRGLGGTPARRRIDQAAAATRLLAGCGLTRRGVWATTCDSPRRIRRRPRAIAHPRPLPGSCARLRAAGTAESRIRGVALG